MKIQDIVMQQNINRGKAPAAPAQANLPVEKDARLWEAAKGFETVMMTHGSTTVPPFSSLGSLTARSRRAP